MTNTNAKPLDSTRRTEVHPGAESVLPRASTCDYLFFLNFLTFIKSNLASYQGLVASAHGDVLVHGVQRIQQRHRAAEQRHRIAGQPKAGCERDVLPQHSCWWPNLDWRRCTTLYTMATGAMPEGSAWPYGVCESPLLLCTANVVQESLQTYIAHMLLSGISL